MINLACALISLAFAAWFYKKDNLIGYSLNTVGVIVNVLFFASDYI